MERTTDANIVFIVCATFKYSAAQHKLTRIKCQVKSAASLTWFHGPAREPLSAKQQVPTRQELERKTELAHLTGVCSAQKGQVDKSP